MKLIIYYENLKQELEVDTNEMWSCLKLTSDKELSDEEREKMIQDKVDMEWNKEDYNNWRRFRDHRFTPNFTGDEDDDAPDYIDTFPDVKEAEKFGRHEEYVSVCKNIRDILKKHPKWADMVIAIALDGYKVTEYAKEIGTTRSNVAHQYNDALKILKKYYKNIHGFNIHAAY